MPIKCDQGDFLGQFVRDALGSLIEFESLEEICLNYPNGGYGLADGGTWNTITERPTVDSEMVLLLAQMLIVRGTYDSDAHSNSISFSD